MATLYELDNRIAACIDPETGEIVDVEALTALEMERDAKLEGVALAIKNLTADVAAYKQEKQSFADKQAAAEKRIERLKTWLAQVQDGQKFKTARVSVSFRAATSVDVAEGAEIPEEYKTAKTTYTVSKTLLREALEAGQQIDGVTLKTGYAVTIK